MKINFSNSITTNQTFQNKFHLNKWNDFKFIIDDTSGVHLSNFGFLTTSKILFAVNTFKEFLIINVIEVNDNNLKIAIIFKVVFSNGQCRNISYLQILNIQDIDKLNSIFTEFWNLRSEDYHTGPISAIIFSYKVFNSDLPNKFNKVSKNKSLISQNSKLENNFMKFKGYKLHNNMDITLWGDSHFLDERNAIIYKKYSHLEYHVKLFDKYQLVDVRIDDNILFSFKDVMKDKDNLLSFSRIFKDQEYHFINGEIIFKKTRKKCSFLKKIKTSDKYSTKFITMDLETRCIDNIIRSYSVSIYDGQIKKSFYLSDFYSEDIILDIDAEKEMLKASIKYLMKRKYHNYKIYFHNFSKFDAVFLLSIMSDLSNDIKPIMRDGLILDLAFKYADKYYIYFRDSILLLPDSLKKLAINFNCSHKGIFPHRFVNDPNVSLDYEGDVPDFKYFDNITFEQYKIYLNQYEFIKWNLRNEILKYSELDCLVLYEIISKYADNIFKKFKVNLINYPTLASLGFAIFRSNFLTEYQIPLIEGDMYDFIQKAYTGGSVDVYIPTIDSIKKDSNNINKVYRYDVNSLYPYVMKNYDMPIGTPYYFEGDITKSHDYDNENKPYGIFEVDIIAPKNIKIPLLQTRVKISDGTFRTIAPIGNWSGYYFSDELYNAAKFGYTFKIKRGYLFQKGNIFKPYVDALYEIKENSIKGTPDYTISKYLLNCIYGRFGMNPVVEQHIIIQSTNSLDFYYKYNVTNRVDLNNGKELLSYFYESSHEDYFYNKNVSVVVSAIVTASARIHMSKFKTDDRFNLYYSDTDSIDVDVDLENLNSNYIGTKLGDLKKEHIFTDVVYLAPKVYGGMNDEYEYVKIKGLKNPIKFEQLKLLLNKNSKLEVEQEKWYKDFSNSQFNVKQEIYTLLITEGKRKVIFGPDNKFNKTVPFELKDGKIID